MDKHVYFFGAEQTEGNKDMKKSLGGKGANLAEMASIGIPVPPGFTITTETCAEYYENNKKLSEEAKKEIEENLVKLETAMNAKFGGSDNPLLLSVRSGAAVSMPGMMDTVLNLGLNDESVKGLIKKAGNERLPGILTEDLFKCLEMWLWVLSIMTLNIFLKQLKKQKELNLILN